MTTAMRTAVVLALFVQAWAAAACDDRGSITAQNASTWA